MADASISRAPVPILAKESLEVPEGALVTLVVPDAVAVDDKPPADGSTSAIAPPASASVEG